MYYKAPCVFDLHNLINSIFDIFYANTETENVECNVVKSLILNQIAQSLFIGLIFI